MRMSLFIVVASLAVTPVHAQLVGGQVGAGVGGAVGGAAGSLGSTVGGQARVDPTLPDATRAAGDATRQVGRAADRSTRAAARTADRAARSGRKSVRVEAGASVRVGRGTRCYYDDYYYDPVYRDGYYYCERSGTAIDAGAGTGG